MLKFQLFFIRSYLYWTIIFRQVWYTIRYKGEDNIPLEKIRKLRMQVKFKGREIGYSSRWVREKLQLTIPEDSKREYQSAWLRGTDVSNVD